MAAHRSVRGFFLKNFHRRESAFAEASADKPAFAEACAFAKASAYADSARRQRTRTATRGWLAKGEKKIAQRNCIADLFEAWQANGQWPKANSTLFRLCLQFRLMK